MDCEAADKPVKKLVGENMPLIDEAGHLELIALMAPATAEWFAKRAEAASAQMSERQEGK